LIQLKAPVVTVQRHEPKPKEMPVAASTMLALIIGALIFATFAGSLAWHGYTHPPRRRGGYPPEAAAF
jgi:hypothetical protein